MKPHGDLKNKLLARYNVLARINFQSCAYEMKVVVDWIRQQPAVMAIIAEAEQEVPEFDLDEFKMVLNSTRNIIPWPAYVVTDAGRAAISWRILADIADSSTHQKDASRQYVRAFSVRDNQGSYEVFVDLALRPFFEYAIEHVGDFDSILYVLQRYVRDVEWHRRDDLYAKFVEDTANGEEVYNLDLQRHLYMDGGFITHAKVASASGQPDLIGGLDSVDPLICDGKLIKSGTGPSYIATGFNQVIKYAQDYNKTRAFLVVFNLTDRLVEFPSDDPKKGWPSHVTYGGVRVYFVEVRALPPATTASKAGKLKPLTLTREDLFADDE